MFCNKCGSELEEGVKFCKSCGASVEQRNVAGGMLYQTSQSGAFNQTAPAKKLDMMDMIVLVGAVLMVLATFLPYVKVSILGYSESTTLLEGGDGKFFIIAAIIVAVFTIIKKWAFQLIGAVISVGLMVVEAIDTSDVISQFDGFGERSIGFYLMVISAIVMIGGSLAKKLVKRS